MLDKEKERINWGKESDELPEMTIEEVETRTRNGDLLIIIEDVVHNVSSFLNLHPGGSKFLKYYAGKDATLAFNGKVYDHSNAGRNLKRKLRIAKLKKN